MESVDGRVDYLTDNKKHFIRKNLWLPACVKQRELAGRHLAKVPLRYFTFCAEEAIDVFMLARERILPRQPETGRLEGVYFCEADEIAFSRIAGLVGSPERGFLGDFTKIVLFEDDPDTTGKELFSDDAYYSEETRRKLLHKDAQKRLQQAFPFDIINLDVFGLMFPRQKGVVVPRTDGVIGPLLESILRIFQWQTESKLPNGKRCERFTLLLTSHVDPQITDQEAVRQLTQRIEDNIQMVAGFREALYERHGAVSGQELASQNFPAFFCVSVAKYIISIALQRFGWQVDYGPVYLYNRENLHKTGTKYQMMHSVAVFERMKPYSRRLDDPIVRLYGEASIKVAETLIEWVEDALQEPGLMEGLHDDVRAIIRFRDGKSYMD